MYYQQLQSRIFLDEEFKETSSHVAQYKRNCLANRATPSREIPQITAEIQSAYYENGEASQRSDRE